MTVELDVLFYILIIATPFLAGCAIYKGIKRIKKLHK